MATKQIKITRREMITFFNYLHGLKGKYSSQFSYFITRNLKYMNDEYESMAVAENMITPTERYNEFQQKRFGLMDKYTIRATNSIMTNGAAHLAFNTNEDR